MTREIIWLVLFLLLALEQILLRRKLAKLSGALETIANMGEAVAAKAERVFAAQDNLQGLMDKVLRDIRAILEANK